MLVRLNLPLQLSRCLLIFTTEHKSINRTQNSYSTIKMSSLVWNILWIVNYLHTTDLLQLFMTLIDSVQICLSSSCSLCNMIIAVFIVLH